MRVCVREREREREREIKKKMETTNAILFLSSGPAQRTKVFKIVFDRLSLRTLSIPTASSKGDCPVHSPCGSGTRILSFSLIS